MSESKPQTSLHAINAAILRAKLDQPCTSRDIPGVSDQYIPRTKKKLVFHFQSNTSVGKNKTVSEVANKPFHTSDVFDVYNVTIPSSSKHAVFCSDTNINELPHSCTCHSKSIMPSGYNLIMILLRARDNNIQSFACI